MHLPDPEILDRAREVVRCATALGVAHDDRVFTVVDYGLPSTAERLWVLDLAAGRVLFRTRVAHGKGSGDDRAVAFSNDPGSHQTSLGVFRTAEVYTGEHGRSLRLDGLEPGINDLARTRTIVIHPADYVTDSFVAAHGRCGRSWGCPALDPAVAQGVIDAIAGGSLLLAWYPDDHWLATSTFLHCGAGDGPAAAQSGGRSPD